MFILYTTNMLGIGTTQGYTVFEDKCSREMVPKGQLVFYKYHTADSVPVSYILEMKG